MGVYELVFAVCGFFGVTVMSILLYEIRRTRESIEKLNEKVAIIIGKVELHENRIDRIENHIYAPS